MSKVAQFKLARVYGENKSSNLKIVCLLFCKYQVNTVAVELAQWCLTAMQCDVMHACFFPFSVL